MGPVRRALLVVLSALVIAAPASPNGQFRFKRIHIDNLTEKSDEAVVYDPDNLEKGGYHPAAKLTFDELDVLESGRFLSWVVSGDFANTCWSQGISSGTAVLYVPNGPKSGSLSCDGQIDQSRRTIEGTYESNTSISANTIEFAGTLTGRAKYYDRYLDEEPTSDDVGTVKQHAKFEVTSTGCKVVVFEMESRVRKNYRSQDDDGHTIMDSLWVERSGSATTCQLE